MCHAWHPTGLARIWGRPTRLSILGLTAVVPPSFEEMETERERSQSHGGAMSASVDRRRAGGGELVDSSPVGAHSLRGVAAVARRVLNDVADGQLSRPQVTLRFWDGSDCPRTWPQPSLFAIPRRSCICCARPDSSGSRGRGSTGRSTSMASWRRCSRRGVRSLASTCPRPTVRGSGWRLSGSSAGGYSGARGFPRSRRA